MDPNLEAILAYLQELANNTSACRFVFAACVIGVVGYGWRTLWRMIKVAGDVLYHLQSKDWRVD